MVKNQPANAKDMGSTSDLGRSHMLRSNLSPGSTTIAPVSQSSTKREATSMRSPAHQSSSSSLLLEIGPLSNKDPAHPKINI